MISKLIRDYKMKLNVLLPKFFMFFFRLQKITARTTPMEPSRKGGSRQKTAEKTPPVTWNCKKATKTTSKKITAFLQLYPDIARKNTPLL